MSEAISPPARPEKSGRAGIIGWMMFDWAAQPYHTLIITFVFAPYFVSTAASDPAAGQSMWAYAGGIAGMIIAILAPILGTLADETGPRKPWIAGFSVLAILGAIGLFAAAPAPNAPIFFVLASFTIALIGIEFAAVFVNAMMPDLVKRADLGKLSGSGWALGYVGGVIALVISLGLMSASPETGKTLLGLSPIFGLDPVTHEGDRASGPFSALWYFVFVLPLFLFTPDAPKRERAKVAVSDGLRKLGATLKTLPQRKSYFVFLISSMIYRDGLNALYAFGGIYAAGVLGLSIIQIGIFGIIAAIAGALGAFFGGRFDAAYGPRQVVFYSCWMLVLACLIVVSTTPEFILFAVPAGASAPLIVFYIAGCLIGAAGGSLQAASRTLLVDQVENHETTEAFGLYALTGRATSFIGLLAVGVVTDLSASQRVGITPIILLLAAGAFGLFWVRERKVD